MDAEVKKRLDASWKYEPCAAAILGLCFFRRAPELIDKQHHGDLVFAVDRGIVGVRVQNRKWHGKHGDHATFRVKTQSGIETEWEKICAGTGPTHFLSGFRHAKHPEQLIGRWLLLDLSNITASTRVYGPFNNTDGSSLVRMQRKDFPHGALVRSGNYLRVDSP